MIQREAWYRETSTLEPYLSEPRQFEDLPEEYQKAISLWVEGEWETSPSRFLYLVGEIPTEVMVDRWESLLSQQFKDFEDFHRWYIRTQKMPDHPRTKRWPMIFEEPWIKGDDEPFVLDGMHRFNDYFRKGDRTIPVVLILRMGPNP